MRLRLTLLRLRPRICRRYCTLCFWLKVFAALGLLVLLVNGLLTIQDWDCLVDEDNGSSHDSSETADNFLVTRLPSVCWNERCKSQYLRRWQAASDSARPVPPIRHILWRNESVSRYFARQLLTWQRIHPDWTYVLWRDQDLEPFVAAHFPSMLQKFRSLWVQIMRVDMIRYMILFKYGGTYADLDYSLVSSLDKYRRFHSVLTREPESHSLQFLGMSWPVRPMANPAFMMSAPGHIFNHFIIHSLHSRPANKGALHFAGPFGLTEILGDYMKLFPFANTATESVYIPPSHSFYPYPGNRLNTSNSDSITQRFTRLAKHCRSLMLGTRWRCRRLRMVRQLRQYCADVNNMDPITDRSQPVVAVHDLAKNGGIWYKSDGVNLYTENLSDIRMVLPNVKFGIDFMRSTADAPAMVF